MSGEPRTDVESALRRSSADDRGIRLDLAEVRELLVLIDALRAEAAATSDRLSSELREAVEAALVRLERHAEQLRMTRSERLIGQASGIADTAREVRAALSSATGTPKELEAAPEGADAPASCVQCGEVRDAGVHDTADECDMLRGPCLDPGRHHPFRREATDSAESAISQSEVSQIGDQG